MRRSRSSDSGHGLRCSLFAAKYRQSLGGGDSLATVSVDGTLASAASDTVRHSECCTGPNRIDVIVLKEVEIETLPIEGRRWTFHLPIQSPMSTLKKRNGPRVGGANRVDVRNPDFMLLSMAIWCSDIEVMYTRPERSSKKCTR